MYSTYSEELIAYCMYGNCKADIVLLFAISYCAFAGQCMYTYILCSTEWLGK